MDTPALAQNLPLTVRVELAERAYGITLDNALPSDVWGECPIPAGSRVLIVSDSTVAPLYAAQVVRLFERHGVAAAVATVPAGEGAKTLATVGKLYGEAVHAKLDRHGAIVALGGGVVGDLAGFVAATYLRGVRFLQLPTTLLAMVDSSVGGKTGVNLPEGKNLVGAFHQPCAVFVALSTLDTLPYRELAAGMAEVVKYGAIRDVALLSLLEEHANRLGSPDSDASVLGAIVARCCRIKADVVAADERETGERAILNFGHTLGHAIENTLGYGVWLHGEAVSFGMAYAARVAERCGVCKEPWSGRLTALLARFGLPVDKARLARDAGGVAPSWDDLRAAMSGDKKSRGGVPRFVLCDGPGHALYGCSVDEATLRSVWEEMGV
jgi:3-dehydroquinate synthase